MDDLHRGVAAIREAPNYDDPNGYKSDRAVSEGWSSEFSSPEHCLYIAREIHSQWSLLLSLKSETFRTGYKWLNLDIENAFEGAVSSLVWMLPEITEGRLAVHKDMTVSCAETIAHMQFLAPHVRNTFLFADPPTCKNCGNDTIRLVKMLDEPDKRGNTIEIEDICNYCGTPGKQLV